MTQLGKHLVFHLKYMAEMNRLYGSVEEGEEPDLTELGDAAEQVRAMVRTIGAAANEQAVEFLQLCGRGIDDHFTGLKIATIAKKRTRAYVKKNWSWEAEVRVSSVPGGEFWCGVWVTAPPKVHISLAKDVCGAVVPYIYLAKRGRKTADAIWKILGGWPHSRGVEGLLKYNNTVDLACIPIKAQPPESFDVDCDQLVAEVMKIIARIGAEETKAIANFAAGHKESEEG